MMTTVLMKKLLLDSLPSLEMPIQEFIFDGFMVIVLGAFGIASVDKWINKTKGTTNKDEEPK